MTDKLNKLNEVFAQAFTETMKNEVAKDVKDQLGFYAFTHGLRGKKLDQFVGDFEKFCLLAVLKEDDGLRKIYMDAVAEDVYNELRKA